MPEARYEIYRSKDGKYRYRLVAPNNEIIAVGEAYETKAGCLNGIRAVSEYSGALVLDLTTDTSRTITHPGHEQHLCKLMGSGEVSFNQIKGLVQNAKFICRTCGMIAASANNLCSPETLAS